jgi:hypothetical protein
MYTIIILNNLDICFINKGDLNVYEIYNNFVDTKEPHLLRNHMDMRSHGEESKVRTQVTTLNEPKILALEFAVFLVQKGFIPFLESLEFPFIHKTTILTFTVDNDFDSYNFRAETLYEAFDDDFYPYKEENV